MARFTSTFSPQIVSDDPSSGRDYNRSTGRAAFCALSDRGSYYVEAGPPIATSIMWNRDGFNVAPGGR